MSTPAHPDDVDLRLYATSARAVAVDIADAIEGHVIGCPRCRSRIANSASRPLLTRSWSGISERLDLDPARLVAPTLPSGVDDPDDRPTAPVLHLDDLDRHAVPRAARQRAQWLAGAAAAVVAIGAVATLANTGGSDDSLATSGRTGWVDILPPDSPALEGAGPSVGIGAVIQWGDRLVVTSANEGTGMTAWVTGGDSWERRELAPPDGCDPWGGLVAVGDRLAVSCQTVPEGSEVFVATTTDLENWDRHVVGSGGPSFGTRIGPGPNGGFTVTLIEATDVNTTEGSRMRVWTSGDDLDGWEEIPGQQDETFVDAAPQRIHVAGDDVVITGALTLYNQESADAPAGTTEWRPALWVSHAGGPFRRTDLASGPAAAPIDGWAFDFAASRTGYVLVGGLNDGTQALSWTSEDLETWTSGTVATPPSGTGTRSRLWSVATTEAGTLVASGIDSGSGVVPTWFSADDGVTWQFVGDGPEVLGTWNGDIVGARAGSTIRVLRWSGAPARTPTPVPNNDPRVIEVGSIDELPPGSRDVITVPASETHEALFVVRDSNDRLLALSARGPKEGCRIEPVSDGELIPTGEPIAGTAVFHDPCHRGVFDRAGLLIGGPGVRSMYRYEIVDDADRILVDTALAQPGQPKVGVFVPSRAATVTGPTDHAARLWRDALQRATSEVQAQSFQPVIWILGAFHEPGSGIVRLPFTMNEVAIGELVVGPIAVFPADQNRESSDEYELEAGTLYLDATTNDADRVTTVTADMDISRTRRLHAEIAWPADDLTTEDINGLVRLVDLTSKYALEANR